MIRIGKPNIEQRDGRTYLISHIIDDAQKIDHEIYYATEQDYGQYLADEVADTFVVGCLLPAVYYNEDITVECAMSEKLYYNLINSILFILSKIYGNKINIHAEKLINPQYGGSGVGCGCSLGVDSLAAIFKHTPSSFNNEYEIASDSYRITHLTYFNVGAMGSANLEKAKESFEKDLQLVKSFAKIIGLPVVTLESNFALLYQDFNFDSSGDIRNFSAMLSLQKLFGKYLYGSSFPISDFKYDIEQTGYYESLLAPMLSTESTEIIIANPDMSRIDKTKFIVNNPLTQKYLYVCWKETIANKWPNSEVAKIKDKKLNCSHCDKCKRTLLAIDLLGKLPLYNESFDIPYWNSVKDQYIARVIVNRGNNVFYEELYQLMQEKNYKATFNVKREIFKLNYRKTLLWRATNKLKKIYRKLINK